jgi:hypothetical protein
LELREARARSPYYGALLVARLANAQELGAKGVDEDRVLGSRLWFYQSGYEGVFYVLEDDPGGIDVRIVWVGSLRRIGFGEIHGIAERRLAEARGT